MTAQDIATIIADLRARIAQLPTIESGKGDWMDQHRAHREAARQLGAHLTQTYGARIAEKHDTNRIRMHGIASSSTGGLVGTFHNWIAAAERKQAEVAK